jgi:hypothetical protein
MREEKIAPCPDYTYISWKILDIHSFCEDSFQKMGNEWLSFSEHMKKAGKSMVNEMVLRMK